MGPLAKRQPFIPVTNPIFIIVFVDKNSPNHRILSVHGFAPDPHRPPAQLDKGIQAAEVVIVVPQGQLHPVVVGAGEVGD